MADNSNSVDDYLSQLSSDHSLITYLHRTINDVAHRGGGKGGYYNRNQLVMSRFDRFGQNPLVSNNESVGLTFITRPKLNLATTSLRQDPVMAMLDTLDNTTIPFAIRCMLDTKFERGLGRPYSQTCPWFDSDSPFINILTNTVTQCSGWPSWDNQVSQSEDGFFSENQTIAKGSDFLNQTYDLSLTFREVQGGVILALFYYWCRWISLCCRGDVTRYMEDILARRLSYTCSIYRFVLDPYKQNITAWAKATGCFPRSVPFGDKFNITSREHFLDALQEVSIPFTANHIEYNTPDSLKDFNTIMETYAGPMFTSDGKTLLPNRIPLNNSAENNYKGIPYVDLYGGQNRLLWLGDQNEVQNTTEKSLQDLKDRIDSEVAKYTTELKAVPSTGDLDLVGAPSTEYLDYLRSNAFTPNKSNVTVTNPYDIRNDTPQTDAELQSLLTK